MAEKNFNKVMVQIFRHEGGYVHDPRDAGGETNMGISKKAHPTVDIKNLTKESAKAIYRMKYWDKVRAGKMPDGLDLVLMDPAVNSGPARGAKWFQRGLGMTGRDVDGKIGPQTVAVANSPLPIDGVKIIQRACAARTGFLRGLRTWSIYKGGWSTRVASVEAVGVRMWLDAHKAAPTRETLVGLGQEATTASKGQKKAAGATGAGSGAVGVGGGQEIDGAMILDPMALAAVVVILGLIALVVYGRSRNNRIRAKAYEAEAIEMGV